MSVQICFDFPSQPICEFAAENCCSLADGNPWFNTTCLCDFYEYTSSVLDYESEWKASNCSDANAGCDSSYEPIDLKAFYEETGGEFWLNNTGWLDKSISYCQWFGLSCNGGGLLMKMELKNPTRKFEELNRTTHFLEMRAEQADLPVADYMRHFREAETSEERACLRPGS